MCNICFSKTCNLPLLDHLKTRHFDVNLHTVHLDNDDATFYLYNLSGQIVGYQKYNYKKDKVKDNDPRFSRYYTWRKNNVVGVWGLESWNFSKVLFLTEGVFDAARLTNLGYSAVATLGNDLDYTTARWLWTVRNFRTVVAACDNDKAGLKLAKYGTVSHVMEEGKDLGDASDEYVQEFLRKYS